MSNFHKCRHYNPRDQSRDPGYDESTMRKKQCICAKKLEADPRYGKVHIPWNEVLCDHRAVDAQRKCPNYGRRS